MIRDQEARVAVRPGSLLAARGIALWLSCACSGADPTPPPATTTPKFGSDTTSIGTDAAPADTADELAADVAVKADAGADVLPPVVAVLVDTATAVEIGARVAVNVQVEREGLAPSLPQAGEVTFLANGVPLPFGSTILGGDLAQPPVAVWKGSNNGQFWLAGVRPGKVEVVAHAGEVATAPLPVQVDWPTDPQIRVSVPGGTGKTKAERATDAPETYQFTGKTFGAGGLTVTLRFPTAAKKGSTFDFDVAPASGTLSLKATLADLGGVQLVALKGRLWIDQVDDGWFRASFLATTASLQPLVGVLLVERDGKFGLDLLGEPVQLAKSIAPQPVTGDHVSRASVAAVGNGKALVSWRRISNVTTADLVRVAVDAKTGAIDTGLAPLVTKAPAFSETTSQNLPAFGRLSVAASAGKLLAAWEGRQGKGGTLPDRVWMRSLGPAMEPTGTVVEVGQDACTGGCRVQVLRLPSSRWLVLWTVPGGEGVRARRVNGDLSFVEEDAPTLLVQPPAAFARAGSFDANVAAVWQEPGGPAWFRLWNDQLTSAGIPPLPLGKAPGGGVPGPWLAMVSNPAATLTFWCEAGPKGSGGADLKLRRIGLDGKKFGAADLPIASGVLGLAVAGGKLAQALVVERVAATGGGSALRLRKVHLATVADPGAQLGHEIVIPTGTKLPVEAVVAYVPEADAYVVVWSGDVESEGVWMLRVR
jgi:hypothetical protein